MLGARLFNCCSPLRAGDWTGGLCADDRARLLFEKKEAVKEMRAAVDGEAQMKNNLQQLELDAAQAATREVQLQVRYQRKTFHSEGGIQPVHAHAT